MPGGVQKTRRHGTLGYGLAGMVVMGGQLDLMILGVFSNLNDFMIVYIYRLHKVFFNRVNCPITCS